MRKVGDGIFRLPVIGGQHGIDIAIVAVDAIAAVIGKAGGEDGVDFERYLAFSANAGFIALLPVDYH